MCCTLTSGGRSGDGPVRAVEAENCDGGGWKPAMQPKANKKGGRGEKGYTHIQADTETDS